MSPPQGGRPSGPRVQWNEIPRVLARLAASGDPGGGFVKPAKGDQAHVVELHSPPQQQARRIIIEVTDDADADFIIQSIRRAPSARIVDAGNAQGGAHA